jgi:hypothetical protein
MTTLERPKLVARISESLCRRSYPRLQMTLIVTATGLAGFLASFVMLHLGLDAMWIRYPLAVGISYGVFLLLLKAWITYQQQRRSVFENALDLADLNPVDLLPSNRSAGCVSDSASSHSWADVVPALDGGEWVAIVAFVIALAVGLVASLFIVVSAPTLLGEVFLDGIVVAALRKKMIRVAEQHWTWSALRRTAIQFVTVAFAFSLAGGMMHQVRPEAKSIGDIIHPERAEKSH